MADTKHKQIFDAMATLIGGISGITVESVLKQFEDIKDKAELPWIGIFPITATETTGTTAGSSGKQAETDWVALVYVQEADPLSKMLAIYGDIKAALETDPTLGLAFSIGRMFGREISRISRSKCLSSEAATGSKWKSQFKHSIATAAMRHEEA